MYKGLFWAVIVIIGGYFAYQKWVAKDYSKPWFTGSEPVKVCKVPYYSVTECTNARAVSDGTSITDLVVNSTNISTFLRVTCEQAAKDLYNYDQFCVYMENGQRYDILPSWALD